jgi:hypothetical protein
LEDATPDMSGAVSRIFFPSRKRTVPLGCGLPVEETVAVITTICPKVDGFGLLPRLMVADSLATFCINTGDPLLAKLASPVYVAVIGLPPGPSDDVL